MNYHAGWRYFLVGCLAVLGSCLSAFAQSDQGRVAAKVDGTPVTEMDIDLARQDFSAAIADVSPEEGRRILLNAVIDNQLLANAAEEGGIGSGPNLEAKLKYARRRALRDEYFERRILVEATEADAKRLYDEQVSSFSPEEEIRARHLLVASESQAKRLRALIVRGEDFAKLARQHSKDAATKASGGEIGYFLKGQLDEKFEVAAFAIAKGAISQPVKTQFGWHLISVEDRRMRAAPTFEAMQAGIMTLLVQRKTQEVVGRLREKSKIEIVDSGTK